MATKSKVKRPVTVRSVPRPSSAIPAKELRAIRLTAVDVATRLAGTRSYAQPGAWGVSVMGPNAASVIGEAKLIESYLVGKDTQ